MIKDTRELTDGATVRCDICIVGGGVAGLSVAAELLDSGIEVAVVESGDVKPDKQVQSLCEGENIGHPYFPLDTARSRQLGGSSGRWLLELGDDRIGARLRPFDPIDFERREWVPDSGWPFGYDEMEPYYRRAQALCLSGPYRYEPEAWEDAEAPVLPFTNDRVRTAMYQFVDRDVFGRHYRARIAESENVHAYTNASALEVTTDADGTRATGARLRTLGGRTYNVEARTVVLAAGGIETPRLMLLSNRVHMSGLGNATDLVGRYFMEHPHLWSGYLVPADRRLFLRAGLYGIHRRNGVPVLGQLGFGEQVLRERQLLNHSMHLVPGFRHRRGMREAVKSGFGTFGELRRALRNRDLNDFNRHLSTLFPVANDFSIAAYRRAARLFDFLFRSGASFEVFRLNHMAEQMPNPDSRVRLSDTLDRFGQRRVALDWRLSRGDLESLRRVQDVLDEEARRAGIGHVEIELGDEIPPDLHGGWHHMGTTRMHATPRRGVVDPTCRVHGMANLYVAGPSVFPTSGYANPVLTFVALSIRLADHLRKEAGLVGSVSAAEQGRESAVYV